MKKRCLLAIVIVLQNSCRAQSQFIKSKEAKCNCEVYMDTKNFLISKMGVDSFNKIENSIILRYVVVKNGKVEIKTNYNNYIRNEDLLTFIKSYNYRCILNIFQNPDGVVVLFKKQTYLNNCGNVSDEGNVHD